VTVDRAWFVISDLHLNGRPCPRDTDAALPRFLETVVAASPADRRTLVLLGDTFDLQGPERQPAGAVAERLTSLADAHASIFRALAGCVGSGIEVHVVGGNHDIDVIRPAVAASFTTLLGLEPGHPGVRFSPWIVHEPGVLYAEHGSQHYELHRMPTLLSVGARCDICETLPVTPIAAASLGRSWCPATRAAATRVARSVWATRRQERLAQTTWYRELLDREAADLGISGRALSDLAATSRFGVGRALVGCARRVVVRRLGVDRPGAHLAARAAAVHRILTRYGSPAAAYVFGHDHRAERLDLQDPPAAAYLNTGTWSTDVRGRGPDDADRRLFPYVRVLATPAGVDADVVFWRSSR
jgi:Calcineurin-like phosphoesterase